MSKILLLSFLCLVNPKCSDDDILERAPEGYGVNNKGEATEPTKPVKVKEVTLKSPVLDVTISR